jgi:DNA-binding SARP family transcriptional activator/class 3 adenylate cyclase
MQFRILGPLEVADGDSVIPLGGAKQRALLAILLLSANEVVSSDRLVDELWGEHSPESGRTALQVRVSQLRKALGPAGARLRTRAPGYVLRVDREQLDVQRFERLVREADTAEPVVAAAKLREALALWRGPPLDDLSYESFAQPAIARLQELHIAAIEKRLEADLALGRHAELVAELEALVAEHPLRERIRAQLMLALYRCGRQAEALDAYQRIRVQLTAELGIEPGSELRALQTAILNQDQSLAAPPPATGAAPAQPPPGQSASLAAAGVADRAARSGSGIVPDREPPLSEPAATREARKVVTVLFCDVIGSTALGEELDPEVFRGVMNSIFADIRATIERHGGTVEKSIGDAVVAMFGIPRVQEDDALRAVRAAAEIRERLPAIAEEVGVPLRFRAGVNTGLVLVGGGENLAIGDAVNVAARLEQAAQPREILVGPDTLRLVRDAVEVEKLEPFALKGKSQSVSAFRLLDIDPVAPGIARRFDVPLVGRERELRLLREAWERAVAESGCHLFTLLGAAGVGKSRLVGELVSGVGDRVLVLTGRCLHYGEGITFWPLVEALSLAGEHAHAVLERIRSGGAPRPEELFFEVRRSLESLATVRPTMLCIDDLQWAEPMLLDLLDHVVELSRGAAILILCAARPELLEDRPSWGGGKLNATAVMLEPLAAGECEALLELLGDGLDPESRGRVIAASEGNPLFLEEMAALARETGTPAVPPTIHALLAARLERLPVAEREVLECGAIEGEVFHRLAVRALACDERFETDVDSRLAGLVRKELIRPHPAILQGDDGFRFRHLLIRDAAYAGLPKAARGRLHERFARWLEKNAGDLVELDEIAGWHLQQAVGYRRELGQAGELALARAAADHLYAAGRRARERNDLPAARNFLERALALAAPDDARHSQIAVDLVEQLIPAGELAQADKLLLEAEGGPDVSALVGLARLEWLTRVRPPDAIAMIEARLPRMLEFFARSGDERSLARAHMLAFFLHWHKGLATRAGAQARIAARHARKARDEGLREWALEWYLSALTYGRETARAVAQQLDTIEHEQPGPYLAAGIDQGRSEVARLEGRFSDARRLSRQAIEAVRALGSPGGEAGLEQSRGRIELLSGDPAAALAALERSDALLAQFGDRAFRSTTQAWLAKTHVLLGNRDAARTAIKLAEELGGTGDISNFVITHGVRASLALAEGDGEKAERWARSAVDYASRTDDVVDQGNTRLDLARVLSALKRSNEAISEASAALDLFTAKGDGPGAEQTRALLDELRACE